MASIHTTVTNSTSKANEIWQAALGELQLQMTRATFDTWLKYTRLVSYEDGTFIVAAHTTYAKEWLENRLLPQIKRTLAGITKRTVEVRFIVSPPASTMDTTSLPLLQPGQDSGNGSASPQTQATQLNCNYTFDTFIVGSSNRLAQAASQAVADNPAVAYNPLFLYGGVGLGKTHLLHAIGHRSLRKNLRVLYVSSEKFTNDLINSIRNHTTEDFRGKYRSMDVLLVDDIQFIAGKESTQEEFFHTFNTLHAASRQIVISSDRPPKAIVTLEARLRSRFEGGLIADIQPPDLETRIAILRTKAASKPINVPETVIEFIAHMVQSNIRELEGALNRVVACARLTDRPLTLELTTEALQDIIDRRDSVTPTQVLDAVAYYFKVGTDELQGRRRNRNIALPRQVAMFLMREITGTSYPQIGQMLGGRDHSTILHGCDKITTMVEEDDQLRRDVLAIREVIFNNGID